MFKRNNYLKAKLKIIKRNKTKTWRSSWDKSISFGKVGKSLGCHQILEVRFEFGEVKVYDQERHLTSQVNFCLESWKRPSQQMKAQVTWEAQVVIVKPKPYYLVLLC